MKNGIVASFAIYLGLALMALLVFHTYEIWPAAGGAVACAILYGRQASFGVLLGAFAALLVGDSYVGLLTGSERFFAFFFVALSNMVATLSVSYSADIFLQRTAGYFHPANLFRLFTVIPVIYSIVPAVFGIILAFLFPQYGSPFEAVFWFVGDFIGIIIVTPVLLAWMLPITEKEKDINWNEVLICYSIFVLVGIVFFGPDNSIVKQVGRISLLVLIPLFWSAMRFHYRIHAAFVLTFFLMLWTGYTFGYSIFQLTHPTFSSLQMMLFAAGAAVCSFWTNGMAWERQQSFRKMEQLVHYDMLTGLKNRYALLKQVGEMIADRQPKPFSMLYIDIDEFSFFNNKMGQRIGDKLLSALGERLVRYQDDFTTVGRWGSDGFVIIKEKDASRKEICSFADQVVAEVNEAAFYIEGHVLNVTVSMGIVLFPEDGRQIEEFLKHAELSLKKAKELGKNRWVAYDEELTRELKEKEKLEQDLERALRCNEFELYYQPQMDLKDMRIIGFEALLRWPAPGQGTISPAQFIPLAEQTGLIIPIGQWVISQAASFAKELMDEGVEQIKVSVNVSPIQLFQKDFTQMVKLTLGKHQLPSGYFGLEVTESVLIERFEQVVRSLKALKEEGIVIALDDFGTGYSSLSYLQELPLDVVKIDKSFLDDMAVSRKKQGLVNSIIQLSHQLDLKVVAEGLEERVQLELLKEAGCNWGQGYYFSRPLPAKDAKMFLKRNRILEVDV